MQSTRQSVSTPKRRVATRSPVALARKALEVTAQTVPAYSGKFSRKDFTQHQLLAILVLKQFFKTDDRGIVALLQDLSDLRQALGLKKVPHDSTLFKAQRRLLKKGAWTACWKQSCKLLAERGLLMRSPRRP